MKGSGADVQRKIRNTGSYPAVVTPDELSELSAVEGAIDRRFSQEMVKSLDRWMDMADGIGWDIVELEAPSSPDLRGSVEMTVDELLVTLAVPTPLRN